MGKLKKQGVNRGTRIQAKQDDSKPATFEHPVFCFRMIQNGFGLEDCSNEDAANFGRALQRISQLKWNSWYQAPRKGMGLEKIRHNALKVPIPKVINDDITFQSARFGAKKSFIGYRSGYVFRVLWIDRDFKCYDH